MDDDFKPIIEVADDLLIEEEDEVVEEPVKNEGKEPCLYDMLGQEYIANLDQYFLKFCKEVRRNLRDFRDEVIAISGYPGTGKSHLTALMGCLIDRKYKFSTNISFIPTSKQIKDMYLSLPMYSVLHIDEASRGLHKHKWHDKLQQTLNELYDTDREGHYLCTILDMPRFQDFAEKFRNFRISWHIWVIERGIAIVYKKDVDKDIEDPWHTKESIKMKNLIWRNKKLYERSIPEIVRIEQKTPNYCFYFRYPKIPDEIWAKYQEMKRASRVEKVEEDSELESPAQRLEKEKLDKMTMIKRYVLEGKKNNDIGLLMGLAGATVSRYRTMIHSWERVKGEIKIEPLNKGYLSARIQNPPKPFYNKIKEDDDE